MNIRHLFVSLVFVVSLFFPITNVHAQSLQGIQVLISKLQVFVAELALQVSRLKTSSQTALISGAGSGLVAHYTFEEGSGITAGDSAGSNTGTLLNEPTWTAGKIGYGALSFDGVNDYLNAGTGINLSGAVSVALWLKGDVENSSGDFIVGRGQASAGVSNTKQYLLYYSANQRVAFQVSNGTTILVSNGLSNNLPNGVWKHVVGTYDGISTTKLYIDGVEVDSDTLSNFGSLNVSALGVGIGSRQTGGASYFKGEIDDVRIYNRALSPSEISELYLFDGKTTQDPSSPAVNGVCGSVNNQCLVGTLNDVSDSSTQYVWQCLGINGGVDTVCSFPMPATNPVEPIMHTFTVSKVGTGDGTVSTTRISCGSSCSDSFTQGTTLLLTATPTLGSTFVGWEGGGCSGIGNCVVTLNSNIAVTAQFNKVLVSTNSIIYTIKKDNTGDFNTIQACVDVAKAGDICEVYPGVYDERVSTKRGGIAENSRIILRTKGKVTMKGFDISHPYVTVEGFDITGFNQNSNGHIRVLPSGNYCQIINNTIRDGAKAVYGISFPSSGQSGSAECVIRGNTLSNLNYMFIGLFSYTSNHLFEKNIFEYMNGCDYLRVFGQGHVFRKNIFRLGIFKEGCDHSDFVQSFGENGGNAQNMLFEENWIENLEAALGQLNSGGSSGLVPTFRDWVFKNNVFVNVTGNWSIGFPGMQFYNNTFYRTAYTQSGLSFGGQYQIGDYSRALVKNNVFVGGGTGTDISGFYSSGGISLSKQSISRLIGKYGYSSDPLVLSISKSLVDNKYTDSNGKILNAAANVKDLSQFIFDPSLLSYKQLVYNALVEAVKADSFAKQTFDADYNFVSGGESMAFNQKRTRDCPGNGGYAVFNFCEVHGINGGNPKFSNISNPLGLDGIPFTSDDGLIPLSDSPLCTGGLGGGHIGAYSCSGIISNIPLPITGACSITLNQCVFGTLSDVADSSTSHLWNCLGLNGGTTASCSAPIPDVIPPDSIKFARNQKVQTIANTNVRQTPNGILLGSQVRDSRGVIIGGPQYVNSLWWWNINYDTGLDGWSAEDFLAVFSEPLPNIVTINGACGSIENMCNAGILSDVADSSTSHLWNCLGLNGGTTASCSLSKPSSSVSSPSTQPPASGGGGGGGGGSYIPPVTPTLTPPVSGGGSIPVLPTVTPPSLQVPQTQGAVTIISPLTSPLYKGLEHQEVRALQTFLYTEGYLPKDAIIGYFGPKTEKAVQEFQRKNNVVTGGSAEDTGYGLVGGKTRSVINTIIQNKYSSSGTSSTTTTILSEQQKIEVLQKQLVELQALVAKLMAQLAEVLKKKGM